MAIKASQTKIVKQLYLIGSVVIATLASYVVSLIGWIIRQNYGNYKA